MPLSIIGSSFLLDRKDRLISYSGIICLGFAFFVTLVLARPGAFLPLILAGASLLYLTQPVREILIFKNQSYLKKKRRAFLGIVGLALGVLIFLADATYGIVFSGSTYNGILLVAGLTSLGAGEVLWIIVFLSARSGKPA